MNTGHDKSREQAPAIRHLAAGSFLVAAAALFALTCSFNDSASAHVKKGSFLERHKGFILNMQNKNGGKCCNGDDAFEALDEKMTIDSAGVTHYRVKVTTNMKGEPLPGGGVWVDIPDEDVLTIGRAKSVCDNMPANDPDKATCKAPPINILWADVDDGRRPPGEGMPDLDDRPVKVLVGCYYPKPRIGGR